MADDVKQQASSPAPEPIALKEAMDVAVASEQAQETQTPTAEQGETQEQEQRVPYSRFKEINEEKKYWQEQAMKALQERQVVNAPQQIQTPADPYANATPEERVFWQKIEEIADRKADQKLKANVLPMLEAGRMELAQLKVAEFRKEHSDIKPNSPEEMEIASKIQMGYHPNDAYWAVMGPRGVQRAEDRAVKQVTAKFVQKKQANVETQGVSQAAKPQEKLSWREQMLANLNKFENT